jgi:hypothetical protein
MEAVGVGTRPTPTFVLKFAYEVLALKLIF